MQYEVATYSRKALNECVDLVRSMRWTVDVKAQHPWKCYEVAELLDLCAEKTGDITMRSDWNPYWEEYRKAVERKERSKKRLDQLLKDCHKSLADDLNLISSLMNAGKVNEVD